MKIFKIFIFLFIIYTIPFLIAHVRKAEVLEYMKDEVINYEIKFLKNKIRERAIASGKTEQEADEIVSSYEPIFQREKDKFYRYCDKKAWGDYKPIETGEYYIDSTDQKREKYIGCVSGVDYSFNYFFESAAFYHLIYYFDDETKALYDSLSMIAFAHKPPNGQYYKLSKSIGYYRMPYCAWCNYGLGKYPFGDFETMGDPEGEEEWDMREVLTIKDEDVVCEKFTKTSDDEDPECYKYYQKLK